jgi:hypothetical protein
MLTIEYEVYRALTELRIQELRRQAKTRRTPQAKQRAQPGWLSSRGRRLCGWLGAWLVALGRKLQAGHRHHALPLEQA